VSGSVHPWVTGSVGQREVGGCVQEVESYSRHAGNGCDMRQALAVQALL
jgi:hypothetical protein